MATQIIEFEAPSGLTLTARLFIEGSDTVQYTASSVVESSNRYGVYQATFSSVSSGNYQLVASVGSTAVAVWWGFAEDLAQVFTFGVRLSIIDQTIIEDLECHNTYTAQTPNQTCGTDLFAFTNEEKEFTISIVDGDGDEIDISSESLTFTIEDNLKRNKQVIEDGDLSKSGNEVTFTVASDTNDHPYKGYWSIRRDSDNTVVAYGSYNVVYSASP